MTILHTHEQVTFARQLRSWRGRHGLSQSAAALALGASGRTLQDWEQGRRRPGLHTLAELVRRMNYEDKTL